MKKAKKKKKKVDHITRINKKHDMNNMARQLQMGLFQKEVVSFTQQTHQHSHAVDVVMEMLMPYYGMHRWQQQALLQPETGLTFCKTFSHLSQTSIFCQPTTLFCSNPKGRVKKEKEWKKRRRVKETN